MVHRFGEHLVEGWILGSSATVCVSEMTMGATWRTQMQGGVELYQVGIFQDMNPVAVSGAPRGH